METWWGGKVVQMDPTYDEHLYLWMGTLRPGEARCRRCGEKSAGFHYKKSRRPSKTYWCWSHMCERFPFLMLHLVVNP